MSEPVGRSHTHNSMRDVMALVWVAFYIFGCIALIITMSARWAWFKAAVATFMLGRALGYLALNPHFTRSRGWLGLSFTRGYRLQMCCYVIAGGVAMIGALISLPLAFGLIVAFGAFCWVWLWGCLLMQSRHWTESCPAASPEGVA